MGVAEEIVAIVSSLAPEEARQVLAFARFLAEKTDDAWDARLDAAQNSPRFIQRLAEVDHEIAEGETTPLDIEKL